MRDDEMCGDAIGTLRECAENSKGSSQVRTADFFNKPNYKPNYKPNNKSAYKPAFKSAYK